MSKNNSNAETYERLRSLLCCNAIGGLEALDALHAAQELNAVRKSAGAEGKHCCPKCSDAYSMTPICINCGTIPILGTAERTAGTAAKSTPGVEAREDSINLDYLMVACVELLYVGPDMSGDNWLARPYRRPAKEGVRGKTPRDAIAKLRAKQDADEPSDGASGGRE